MSDTNPPPSGPCAISNVDWSNQFVPAEATISGRNLYASASANDVRTRVGPRSEGAEDQETSQPPSPDPGGSPARLIISAHGLQIVAQLAHNPTVYAGQRIDLNVRCGDGRGWTGWTRIV